MFVERYNVLNGRLADPRSCELATDGKILPPTCTLPPIPTPPATVNAPVVVDVALVVPGIDIFVATKVVPLNVRPELNVVAPPAIWYGIWVMLPPIILLALLAFPT